MLPDLTRVINTTFLHVVTPAKSKPTKKQGAAAEETTNGNFNQAAIDLNAWMAAHKGRSMEIPTDELYAISNIEKIPYTRGLDENHVEELIRSFCKTGTVNKQIWYVFWGCKFAREPPESRWGRSIRDLAEASIGVGPMAGQHSITAIFRCRKRYPKNPNWARVTIIPVMCDDSTESRKQIECWGLRSNYVSGTFLSPRFKDTALAMRRSFEDLLRRTGGTSLTTDLSTALCKQFSEHGNITLEYGRQIWALVRRGPEAWSRIAALLEGRVTNTSKSKFKEIKSPSLLQPMVTLDRRDGGHLARQRDSGQVG